MTKTLTKTPTKTRTATRPVVAALFWLCAAPLRAQSVEVTLRIDGRASANPTVAAVGAFVAVAWSAATVSSMDLFVAVSRDAGATFSAPVQVNRTAGDARVSGENPPRLALVPRAGQPPEIVVVWTTRAGGNSVLQYARSRDGGRTFGAAMPVPGSSAPGGRGWHAVDVDNQGRISVLWLDHRQLASTGNTHAHGQPPAATASAPTSADPTARARLSRVYVTRLSDDDASEVASSPCYCCKTALVSDGSTRYAAWRHVFPDGERDIAFAAARAGARDFSPLQRLSNDHWKLDGCPDNGPALAVDRAHVVHAVWPTMERGAAASDLSLFYARSRGGEPFGPRVRLPTHGSASHVQIAVGTDQAPVAVWDEVVNGDRHLAAVRLRPGSGGQVRFESIRLPGNATGSWYPAVASASSGVFVVWVRPQPTGSVIGMTRLP